MWRSKWTFNCERCLTRQVAKVMIDYAFVVIIDIVGIPYLFDGASSNQQHGIFWQSPFHEKADADVHCKCQKMGKQATTRPHWSSFFGYFTSYPLLAFPFVPLLFSFSTAVSGSRPLVDSSTASSVDQMVDVQRWANVPAGNGSKKVSALFAIPPPLPLYPPSTLRSTLLFAVCFVSTFPLAACTLAHRPTYTRWMV